MFLSDTEITRINVLRNVTHTVGAKKTGAVNCVSRGNNNNKHPYRLTGYHMKRANSPQFICFSHLSPGLADAQFGTCLSTDEWEQILQRRHFCRRSDIEVSFKFATSHQAAA